MRVLICAALLLALSAPALAAPALTVYLAGSQFEDPLYNWTAAFERWAGIPIGSVEVVKMTRGNYQNEIVSAKPYTNYADVVFGINQLDAFSLPRDNWPFANYTAVNSSQIRPDLLARMDPGLYPYDWGYISLVASNTKVSRAFQESLKQLNLSDLAFRPDVARTFVMSDPRGSTGAAWLASAVAHFGDPRYGIEPLSWNKGKFADWREWFAKTLENIIVVDSWATAFDYFNDKPEVSAYLSYSTSPAYSWCMYQDNTTYALPLDGLKWNIIEVVGIHKNASANGHLALAQKFIDFFMSTEFQANVPRSNWMFPSNTLVDVPDCYKNAQPVPILPTSLQSINERIPTQVLRDRMEQWKNEWFAIYKSATHKPDNSASSASFNAILAAVLSVVALIFTTL